MDQFLLPLSMLYQAPSAEAPQTEPALEMEVDSKPPTSLRPRSKRNQRKRRRRTDHHVLREVADK